MSWRFYVQRPKSGLWLDTNAQLYDPELTWKLSGPNTGKAIVPAGMGVSTDAEDGKRIWGKWNTLLFAEEDGELAWAGICTAANPDEKGLSLEFVGPWGWTQHIPYNAVYSHWRTNAFDVVRALIEHAETYKPGFNFSVPSADSQFFVGDTQPPDKPKEPHRKKGEKLNDFYDSKRYKDYKEDLSDWNKLYGQREKFEIAFYEAPYVGEEIDALAKEVGFDYREGVEWKDRGALKVQYNFELKDSISHRRDDIQFVDGMNLAQALDPKDGSETYANRVIGLGAGEGRKMLRVAFGDDDGRLYQAQFVQYKSVRAVERLRALVKADHAVFSTTDPKIDELDVWDVPGFASTSSLRVGDEVKVLSQNTVPPVDAWVRILTITRGIGKSTTHVGVETI
jgi:hypothetical protein